MKFSKEQILSLLHKLNDKLRAEEMKGELYLMGGAVMCLAYDARASTRDIDCFFKPSKAIREKAAELANEEKLSKDWLNDGVKGFLSDHADFQPYLQLSHLNILQCTPEYLLAMKCLAMRIGEEFQDLDDVRFLLRYLNITHHQDAVAVISTYYPEDRFPQKTFYALEEILET